MLIALRVVLLLVGRRAHRGTLVNFSKHPHWAVRIWDFPRIATARSRRVGAAYGTFFHHAWYDWALLGGLAFVLGAAALHDRAVHAAVAPAREASTHPPGDSSFRLVMSNVLMENTEFDRWHEVVGAADPDVIVAVEVDHKWDAALRPLAERYPHAVRQVQDNYYGMVLYSRLPVEEPKVKFLVQDDVPSIHATIVLRDGQRVCLHALHPRPPEPINDQDSAPRDAELVLMGKEIGRAPARPSPTFVCGDLNDVAWSATTQLFSAAQQAARPAHGPGALQQLQREEPAVPLPARPRVPLRRVQAAGPAPARPRSGPTISRC
jgi:endonuclease/exonuclease/phosphatase (EEP) superfamily protein YafD